MDSVRIRDILWGVFAYLPHCQISIRYIKMKARKRFKYKENKDISIISVNCIGGAIYSVLGLKFLSPLINTSLDRKDYLRLCGDLQSYMKCPLKIRNRSDGAWYGVLEKDCGEKVEIDFIHYNDPKIIMNEWNERKKRLNYNKLVFICDDKGLEEADYEKFDKIEAYRKVMLTAREHVEYGWCHQILQYKDMEYTGQYNFRSLRGGWKFLYLWDYISFLNGRE